MKHLPFELRMEIYDLIDPKNCIFAELKIKNNIIFAIIPNKRFIRDDSTEVWLLTLKNDLRIYSVSISLLQKSIVKSNTFRESFAIKIYSRLFQK